jgi:Ca2+-transporting ATPase
MYQGVMIGAIPLVAFLIGLRDGGESLGQTMAFVALVFAQLMHVRNLHSNTRSSFTISPLKNKPLIGAIIVSACLALIVVLIPPFRDAFGFSVMDAQHWWLVAGMSLLPLVIVDFFKLFRINGTKNDL